MKKCYLVYSNYTVTDELLSCVKKRIESLGVSDVKVFSPKGRYISPLGQEKEFFVFENYIFIVLDEEKSHILKEAILPRFGYVVSEDVGGNFLALSESEFHQVENLECRIESLPLKMQENFEFTLDLGGLHFKCRLLSVEDERCKVELDLFGRRVKTYLSPRTFMFHIVQDEEK